MPVLLLSVILLLCCVTIVVALISAPNYKLLSSSFEAGFCGLRLFSLVAQSAKVATLLSSSHNQLSARRKKMPKTTAQQIFALPSKRQQKFRLPRKQCKKDSPRFAVEICFRDLLVVEQRFPRSPASASPLQTHLNCNFILPASSSYLHRISPESDACWVARFSSQAVAWRQKQATRLSTLACDACNIRANCKRLFVFLRKKQICA